MFRVITIHDILDGDFNEESFELSEAFFFTIKVDSYYAIYNKSAEIIGIVPSDYNMFFRVEHDHSSFEDVDMPNVLRLFEQGDGFSLIGTKSKTNKVRLIHSCDIARFELVEDSPIQIPFTNRAFDSEGIVVFKNMNALADSLDLEDLY
jgi:hypothetical protein